MAIGPWEPAGKNHPNFDEFFGGVINERGAASGSNVWAPYAGCSIAWKWRHPVDAKGLMNSALIPTTIPELVLYTSEEYDNKWIFLSGDVEGQPHGMIYWFWFGLTGNPDFASNVAMRNPDGLLWMHNYIPNIPVP